MAFSYTAYKRFTKALTTWVTADADLVTLTGHTASTGGHRIYVIQGTDLLERDSLLIDPYDVDPWHPDVDHVFVSMVRFYSYTARRVTALDVIGAAYKLCSMNETTRADASFESDNTKTRVIRPYGINMMGRAMFEASSIRRTERSDSPLANRHMCGLEVEIVWEDTT